MPKRRFNAPQRMPQRKKNSRRPAARKPLVFLIGIALGALVWFAPAILVNSPLKGRILASVMGDFQGTVSVGSIRAGWLSKLRAENIVVLDAGGEGLVEAASIQLDKNLISLLRNRSELGMIRVQHPIVNLVLRGGGSNIEDAIAPWLAPSDQSSIGCEFEIEEGVVQVTDVSAGSQWTATKLNVGVSLPRDAAAPRTLHVDSLLNPPRGPSGTILADMLWKPGSTPAGHGNLTVRATALPIELASPALQRLLPGAMASGLVDGDVLFDWGETNCLARISQLSASNLHVVAPQWLGTDQLKLESLAASGEVTQRGDVWQVQQLTLDSEIGQVTANGMASLPAPAEQGWAAAMLEALRNGTFQIDGQIDLARIARMLPATLKIREGTHMATGEVTLALSSELDTSGKRWNGRIEARNLSAMHEGRRLTWDQPMTLTAAARDLNGVVAFDKLVCQSSFLEIIASGTSQQGTATLQGDFGRLATELGQFVDLGDLRLAGQLDGKIEWHSSGDRRIRVSAAASAERFELVSANRPAWREDRLVVQLTGVGTLLETGSSALDDGEVRVQSGQDQLTMTLLPTPAGAVRAAALPVDLRLSGELHNWVARLQPIFVLPGWDVDGTIDLDADARVAANQIQIDEAHVRIDKFRASNGSVFISEPVIQLDTKATLDRSPASLRSPDTTLASSSIALRATSVDVQMGAEGPRIAGEIDYRGDVGRLASLFSDPRQPPPRQLQGQATGRARFRCDGHVTSCEFSADVTEFAYAIPSAPNATRAATAVPANSSRWSTIWQEPKLKLAATVAYDGANGLVQVARVEAAGDVISFAARGTVSELAQRGMAEFDGQVAYDLQKVSRRFRGQLGEDFQIAGRDTRPFRFQGPLLGSRATANADGLHPVSLGGRTGDGAVPPESALVQMIAQASLGWTSASVQGIAIGAGEVDARLADGKLVFAPLELAVSEGTLHLAPTVLLDRSPAIVTLPAGPLAEQIRISPQMCSSWLKYLAPLVADATAAQGSFSVSLDQAAIPLDTLAAGEVQGVLEVHAAQIGPGPLSQQLLLLATQIKAIADGNLLAAPTTAPQRWLDLPPQRVVFRMAENRVYHQGLQMAVNDVVIRTSGSVGTDQTISLIAEVPIRDEWLSRSKYLAALRGQTIQVPIHGTLTSPKLDQTALNQITQQTVTGAASRYLQQGVNQLDGEINKQLNRGLEKLIGTPR